MNGNALRRFSSDGWLVAVAAGAAYFAAAKLGLTLAVVHQGITAVWPASGVALAAVLVLGRRVLPAIWLAQFLANLVELLHGPTGWLSGLAFSACYATAGSIEATLGAALVRRYAGDRFLDSGIGAFRFMILSGPFSCAVAALLGPFFLCLLGGARWSQFAELWVTWWAGDSVGVIAVAPMLLAWRVKPPSRPPLRRVIEVTALSAFCGASLLGAFGLLPMGSAAEYPLTFLYIPGLVWSAMRFGPRGAATAILALAGVALLTTVHDTGPFARGDLAQSLLLLQLCVGVMASMTLILAAVAEERRRAEEALLLMNDELEARICARTVELETSNENLRTQVEERRAAAEALRRETDRLSAIVSVQDAIAAAPMDLDEIFRLIAERSRDLVGAEAAGIAVREGEMIGFRVSTGWHSNEPFPRVRADRSLSGRCLDTGETILCNDSEADERTDHDVCRQAGARSVILVPLRRNGTMSVVLVVYSSRPHAFQPADAKALELMAGFLENVLSHVAAFEEKQALLAERTAALEAMREAEGRFAAFMENSPAIAFLKDEEGRYVYVNSEFARAFGGTPESWIGKTVFDQFTPEIARRLHENAQRVWAAGQRMELTELVPTVNGMRYWLVFKFLLQDAKGRPYLAAKGVDITGRVEAERAVREGRERLAAALAASRTGTFRWNSRTDELDADDELYRLFGSAPEAALKTSAGWISLIHPEDRSAVAEQVRRCFSEGCDFGMDYRVVWPDGSIHWLHDKASFVKGEDGNGDYMFGACVDITDRKRAEQALVESERFARSTVNALSAHVAILDESGTIIAVNSAWESFAASNGSTPNPPCARCGPRTNYLQICEEAMGPDREQAVAAAKGIREVLADTRSDFYLEYPCHSPGEQRWFAMRVTRFAGGPPVRLVVAHENITARHQAFVLERERASLKDAVTAMEKVLGVVGHELRTPLAALRALSEFLLTDGASQTVDFDRFLREMGDEVDRMSDTVNNILEAARLNSGKAKWNWGTVDVAETCNDAVETVRPLLDEQRVTLSLTVDPPDWSVQGDGEAVRRLLVNLLSNAKKHTTDGAIRVDVRRVEQEGSAWLRIIVADTGRGMPPEILARVGEAFALNSGVVGGSYIGGTGLGLAICKGIVAAHGGRIRFESKEGSGTTVAALLRTDLAGPDQRAPDRPIEPGAPAPAAAIQEVLL